MLWICRDCGGEIAANDGVGVTEAGWTALDADTGMCSYCSTAERNAAPDHGLARRSAARVRQSGNAVAVTRARGDRRRSERAAEKAPASPLSERHEYVLALFKYGLVDSAQDLPVVMSIAESEACRMCDELVEAGLLDGTLARRE